MLIGCANPHFQFIEPGTNRSVVERSKTRMFSSLQLRSHDHASGCQNPSERATHLHIGVPTIYNSHKASRILAKETVFWTLNNWIEWQLKVMTSQKSINLKVLILFSSSGSLVHQKCWDLSFWTSNCCPYQTLILFSPHGSFCFELEQNEIA